MVELVIADIDGTLRGFERNFGDINRKALQLCHQKGIRLAVASGRPPYGRSWKIMRKNGILDFSLI